MALVDVLDPFLKRRVWPGRSALASDERAMLDATSPTAVSRYANAAWVAAAPGLEASGVRSLLEKREAQHVMVFERGDLVGVMCACDFYGARPNDPIYELMSRRVITIESCATLWMAAKIMSQTGVGCLPVTDAGRVIGMIDRDRLFEAGVSLEATGPICASCGTHRHVPLRGRVRLCLDCFDHAIAAPVDDDAGIDTGVGD
jgi:hypothetical protein